MCFSDSPATFIVLLVKDFFILFLNYHKRKTHKTGMVSLVLLLLACYRTFAIMLSSRKVSYYRIKVHKEANQGLGLSEGYAMPSESQFHIPALSSLANGCPSHCGSTAQGSHAHVNSPCNILCREWKQMPRPVLIISFQKLSLK